MPKFPTTSGGAAGSFVRGNELYENAPAPYYSARRGQDTIHITPGRIQVTRPAQAQQGADLPPHLYAALRYPLAKLQASWIAAGLSNMHPLTSVQYLRGWTLAKEDAPDDQAFNVTQRYLWEWPNSALQAGHLTYVGDGYFVSLAHAPESQWIEDYTGAEAVAWRSRVALVHKNRINGPYLSNKLRNVDSDGISFVLDSPNQLPPKSGERIADKRGECYYLREAGDLLQRVFAAGGFTSSGLGARVSVVPLGWFDATYRYCFAVFGMSRRHRASTRMSCYVYSTGTRDLLHQITEIPQPAQGGVRGPYWVGMMESINGTPVLTSYGRGKMAVVLMPTSYMESGNKRVSGHLMAEGVDPVLMYSEDFGRTWRTLNLPEFRSLARPTQATNWDRPSRYYPELRARIAPLGAGAYLLAAACMDIRMSGDIPDAGYDAWSEAKMAAGEFAGGNVWLPAGGSAWLGTSGSTERGSFMTLFKVDPSTGVKRLTGLDDYKLRLSQVGGTLSGTQPAGTYRYNVVLNAEAASHTPHLVPLGSNAAALIARTVQVQIPPSVGGATNEQSIVYTDIETFMLLTLDGGVSWRKVVLPAQLVSYPDSAAMYLAIGYSTAWKNTAPITGPRNFLPWCVVHAARGGKANARLAFLVHGMNAVHLYSAQLVHKASGEITLSLELVRSEVAPPPYPLAAETYAWDAGVYRAPSGLMYVGDPDSDEFPDVLIPALPNLFK